ncbi:alpha-D-xyloside xylohydrolase [Duganella sp. CF402]|uniref:glycoside hydrolase family 31 protein n=1 Tax=unclassified Duganella TaxID=2636909 RepID=UPI0008BD9330|nr:MULTISPECIES: TIM-barrel domain-containing protein [unclassified Duganella]RZT04304.1 alpha-D-xyloside xylohydrolase [Duganella sp. BK701]SEM40943.1 alpha-D-xyloside xylohydrolase [Duganella sp. CF402]
MRIKNLVPAAAGVAALVAGHAMAGTFEKTATGVVVKPDSGAAKEVRLEVMADNIIHVVKLDQAGKSLNPSLMTVAAPVSGNFNVSASGKDKVTLKAKKISVAVSLATGQVQFFNAAGQAFLTQEAESMAPTSVDGKPFLAVKQGFNYGTKDAFYGLGQHQNHQMNLNGEDVLLMQHNMAIAVPFVVSDKNYGVLWDNNSISRFGDAKPYAWLSRDLQLTDADGKAGGLTARYYVGDKLVFTRREKDIAYQYLKDVAENWPKEVDPKAANLKVVWEGSMASPKAGVHKLQLYSSDYAKLAIDGKQIMDVWRQGWNPWYHNFEVKFEANKPVKLHLEWKPSGGMVAITHNDPLPEAERHSLTFSSEVAQSINYYVINGENIDNVIAGYHQLTGKAPMMPKWAYGFWQSRQRYETQEQLLGVLREYRKQGWPVDNMVQDWFYWPENGWGSHDFDKARFPNAKAMVDEVHKANARIMISIWGKFYANTDNYKELAAKGHMWTKNVEDGALDWVGPGYKNSHYDPYAPEARDIYYRQMKPKLVDLGFDAWWMDNTEPDVLSNTRPSDFKKLIGPTIYGGGEITFNPYSLVHTEGFYQHLKKDQPEKRQFILSRSGFAGIQRNGTAVWSGDTASRWNNLYDQISAGVSVSMSGIANWTHDIGGYAQETRFQVGDVGSAQENRSTGAKQGNPEDIKEWRELNLRWFQFGAFSPLFRSHGEVVKREIHEISPEGSPMRESMVWYDQLRYRLMPYIYSAASDIHYQSGAIMRGLVMDFPNDEAVKDIKDQYLFGRSMLVAPVYEYGARERKVYMPKGVNWYDFYTGELHKGGSTVAIKAPETRMPVLVKAGAILPMGPVTQYVDEKPDAPITLNVYTGADGKFSLYEDDGVSNGYLRGEASRIPLSYNDKTGVVTIGDRVGQYKGMVAKRQFKVRFIKPGVSSTDNFDAADKVVSYEGKTITVKK